MAKHFYKITLLLLVSTATWACRTINSTTASVPVASASAAACRNFGFSLSPQVQVVPNTTQIPTANPDWWNQTPDSKIAVVDLSNGQFLISWGGGAWAVRASTPYPELAQGQSYAMYHPLQPQNFEQAGWWFRDVFRLDPNAPAEDNQELIAFVHVEADWTGRHTKTLAVSYSHDGGTSWSAAAQFLTPYQYGPGGAGVSSGDSGVAYDAANKRWVAFFTAIDPSPNISGNLSIAISSDPLAAPGTWYKYFNGSFAQPGLGGQEESIAAVRETGYISSPAISWNTYLNEWVMVADWGGIGEAILVSPDLYTWSKPQLLMDGKNLGYAGASSAYPTLVGATGDKVTGQSAHLYFAEFSDSDPRIYGRIMLEQQLSFVCND